MSDSVSAFQDSPPSMLRTTVERCQGSSGRVPYSGMISSPEGSSLICPWPAAQPRSGLPRGSLIEVCTLTGSDQVVPPSSLCLTNTPRRVLGEVVQSVSNQLSSSRPDPSWVIIGSRSSYGESWTTLGEDQVRPPSSLSRISSRPSCPVWPSP